MRVESSFAPGRVELLGNHTDYNEGCVLAAALDLGVTMSGSVSDDNRIRLVSKDFGKTLEIPAEPMVPTVIESWANYGLGVFRVFREAGYPVRAFQAEFSSTVPVGSGLSSSAALEVATAMLLKKLFGLEIAPMEVARLCRKAENEFVGVSCGLLDQASSVFGRKDHAVLLDCRDESVSNIRFPQGLSLLIFNSEVAHQLTGGEYNERRNACLKAAEMLGVRALRDVDSTMLEQNAGKLPDIVLQRARHIVGECERVERGTQFLKQGDGAGFGTLMFESHESSRIHFENSTPELDILVEIAAGTDGVLGSRLTGGGFGGATVSLVQSDALAAAGEEIAAKYFERTGVPGKPVLCKIGDGAN